MRRWCPRFQEMPHIGFFRAVLHGVTGEECLARILGLISRYFRHTQSFNFQSRSVGLFQGLSFSYTFSCISSTMIHQPSISSRLKGQCEMLGRREGREHLTVQEFLKVKKFNLESGTALKASQKASTANPEISCNLYISQFSCKSLWRRCWKAGSPQKSNIIMNSSSILPIRSLKTSSKIRTT